MKEVPNKVTTDSYSADEFTNGIKSELQSTITSTNQAFNELDQTQLMQALTRISAGNSLYTDTGAVNAYTLTLSNPFTNMGLTTYFEGLTVQFIANSTNTGAATAAIGALPPTNITDGLGNDLVGGEIHPNAITILHYIGGVWVFFNHVNPSLPPVRGRFDGGANILGNAVGISSATEPAGGRYEITFTTPFANANYFVALTQYTPTNPLATIAVNVTSTTAAVLHLTSFDTNSHAPGESSGFSLCVWPNN